MRDVPPLARRAFAAAAAVASLPLPASQRAPLRGPHPEAARYADLAIATQDISPQDGVGRGVLPIATARARCVVGTLRVRVRELRAAALDTPAVRAVLQHHHAKRRDVSIVVEVAFEGRTQSTPPQRVELALVEFSRPRPIGFGDDGAELLSALDTVASARWDATAPPLSFEVTDISADVVVSFFASAGAETGAAYSSQRALVGKVVVPLLHLLSDEAATIVRRGGGVADEAAEPSTARGAAAALLGPRAQRASTASVVYDDDGDDDDANSSSNGGRAAMSAGVSAEGASDRQRRWYRLFPLATDQRKFVRAASDAPRPGSAVALDGARGAEWEMRRPRHFGDAAAIAEATRAARARHTANVARAATSAAQPRRRTVSMVEHDVAAELAIAAEREASSPALPSLDRAALAGDNAGVACLELSLVLAPGLSPLAAYAMNPPSLTSVHPPHDGTIAGHATQGFYAWERLAQRAGALGAAARRLPPAGLLHRICEWQRPARSLGAMALVTYVALRAPWTQYAPLALLVVAWGALDERAHDEAVARAQRGAQRVRALSERRENWEGPSDESFVDALGDAASDAAGDAEDGVVASACRGLGAVWPSFASGRATTRAQLRATPHFRIWQAEEPGARALLTHARDRSVGAQATAVRERLRGAAKALRAATDAKALAKAIAEKQELYEYWVGYAGSVLRLAAVAISCLEGAVGALQWHDPHVTAPLVVGIVALAAMLYAAALALQLFTYVAALFASLRVIALLLGLAPYAAAAMLNAAIVAQPIARMDRNLRDAKTALASSKRGSVLRVVLGVPPLRKLVDLTVWLAPADASSAATASPVLSRDGRVGALRDGAGGVAGAHDGRPLDAATYERVVLALAALRLPVLDASASLAAAGSFFVIRVCGIGSSGKVDDGAALVASDASCSPSGAAAQHAASEDAGERADGSGVSATRAPTTPHTGGAASRPRTLAALRALTKSEGGTCGVLRKLTRPPTVKGRLAKALAGGGDALSANAPLRGKWHERFAFVTQRHLLYYNSSDEYFAGKAAKKTFDLRGIVRDHLTKAPLIALRCIAPVSAASTAAFGKEDSKEEKTIVVVCISLMTGRFASAIAGAAVRLDETIVLRFASEIEARAWRSTIVRAVLALPETHGLASVPTKQARKGRGGLLSRIALTPSQKRLKDGETVTSGDAAHVVHSKIARRTAKAQAQAQRRARSPIASHDAQHMHGVVYRSEVARGSTTPQWLPFALPIAQEHHALHPGSGLLRRGTPIDVEVWTVAGSVAGGLFGQRIACVQGTTLDALCAAHATHNALPAEVSMSVVASAGDGAALAVTRSALHTARAPTPRAGIGAGGGFFGYFAFQFSAVALPRMDRFTETDGYLRFAIEPPGRAPIVMWTSEVVRATKSPVWQARKVPLRDLCWGLIDAPLSISVWDADVIGADDRIGVVERVRCADAGGATPRLTIRALLECAHDPDVPAEELTFNFVLDAHAEVRRALAISRSCSRAPCGATHTSS